MPTSVTLESLNLTIFGNKLSRVFGPLTNRSVSAVDPFRKEDLLSSLIGVVVLSFNIS